MLQLRTFGGLSVAREGTPVGGAAQQRKPLALLGLLAAAGPPGVSRDKLLTYLWSEADAEHARAALKQTCYALRRDLHASDLFLGTTELRLNPTAVDSDVQRFEDALRRGDFCAAAEAYGGPFLDGFHLRGAPEFERWLDGERERLAGQACAALEELARDASARGDTRGAVEWWRRRAALDPVSAQGALGLMRALDAAGERAEAVRHGRLYQTLVREELEVEPITDVAALTDELQRQTAERPPTDPEVSPAGRTDSAPVPPRRRRVGKPVALAVLVLAVGAALVVVGSRRATPREPHLEAFRRGEQHLRRYALDRAIAAYAEAVALDTSFAIAYHRMAIAVSWSAHPELRAPPLWAQASRLIRGLEPRDSLLVAGAVEMLATNGNPARAGSLFRILDEAVQRYPDDPAIWFALADARFHHGIQMTPARLLDTFDRMIALDSGFALAYVHPVEIALSLNDAAAARRYVRGYLAIPSVNPDGAGMRLLDLLLDPERDRRAEFERTVAFASAADLFRLTRAIRAWPDPAETQIAVAKRLLLDRPHPIGIAEETIRNLFEDALLFRGHLREASHHVTRHPSWPAFMELAELGGIPTDTVESVLDRWLDGPGAASCVVTMNVALWWASRRDTVSLQRLLRREDSLAQALRAQAAVTPARPVPRFSRAALALARADTASALRHFLYEGDALCPVDARPRREIQFRLTLATGRELDAVWVFDRLRDRRVPLVLERARLAERMADRATAVLYYDFVRQAWLNADPELQPFVREARAALRRLGTENTR